MKLSHLHLQKSGDLVRVVATVHFEEKNAPAKEIFIETEAAFADDLANHPHAFAVGCLIPALYFGERRLALEEAICPRLKEGLETVMAIMHHWTAGAFQPLALEAPLLKSALFAQFLALDGKFNPQNTPCIPPVKFFIRLELEQK